MSDENQIKSETPGFEDLEERILSFLEGIDDPEERVERIDDLLHRLEFERRFSLLTPEEIAHMEGELSPQARERLDKAKTKKEQEELIEEYARALLLRRYAWVDYLNGETDEKPFDSSKAQNQAA